MNFTHTYQILMKRNTREGGSCSSHNIRLLFGFVSEGVFAIPQQLLCMVKCCINVLTSPCTVYTAISCAHSDRNYQSLGPIILEGHTDIINGLPITQNVDKYFCKRSSSHSTLFLKRFSTISQVLSDSPIIYGRLLQSNFISYQYA